MDQRLITLMVFVPFLGALAQAFLPSAAGSRGVSLSKAVALGSSIASALFGVLLVLAMRSQTPELQASETVPWIGSYAISYEMGIDGLNVLLVLLVSIVFPVLIGAEWNQRTGARGMHGLLLALQGALLGAVCAQDLLLLFFFWAMSSLPFYFLTGIWGGERRESAAFRGVVTSALGNALLFGALVLVYYSVDPHTFSLRELMGGKLVGKTFEFLGTELSVSATAFGLVSAGLALRAPIWPLHGWFTEVSEEAPPSVLVALSAVSVPVVAYIFVRLTYTLFPDTVVQVSDGLMILGAVNLVVGGICATAQRGLRLLMAFLCMSEVGMILMGIGSLSSTGVVGAIYQEFSLGLGLAGFGLLTGILYERTGKARFVSPEGKPDFGGIVAFAPGVAVAAGIVVASLLGFPGMAGFVGHALLIIGSYPVQPVVVIVAGIVILLATYYLFTMYRLVFLGRAVGQSSGVEFRDLTLREKACLAPLMICLLFFGIYPKPLVELVRPTVEALLATLKP